jgi:FG-GAP-like repeat
MKRTGLMITVLFLVLGSAGSLPGLPARAAQLSRQAIQAPVLKWQRGGCYSSWCETGWYSSPAVGDIDGDGQPEVIASAYSIVALDGATGSLEWRTASGHDRSQPAAANVGRTWPGIVLADLDQDGSPEIVTAHGGGWVSVYNAQGYFESGWPQRPITSELRGLSVADLDGDGTLEIIVTGAVGSQVNTWVYEHNGSLHPGWPQLNNDGGYAWGVYNANAAAGDLDGDGAGEIIVPSDVHYINAYNPDGSPIAANPIYGSKNWGQVGIWESLATELRGWGECNGVRAESYRTNFADGPADIADVNGDGVMEVVATGNVYDCHAGYPPSRYTGVYIFNADRSRFNTGAFDWRTAPVDTGAPISEDYDTIESAEANPALADLDGDGRLEILFASYDGRLHAFWLDKSEHGNWPFSVYQPADGTLSFTSEPAVADLDGDGHAEVIFTSWTQKGRDQTGRLVILDYLGNLLQSLDLPPAFGGADWNGALSAPTLANLEADPDLEVVINSANSGMLAYDLPGTANAIVYWGTGRGSYQRNGVILHGTLRAFVSASSLAPASGQVFTCSLILSGLFSPLKNVSLTAVLPDGLAYAGGLAASSGTPQVAGKLITWSGAVGLSAPVVLSFQAQVDPALTTAQMLTIPFTILDGLGITLQRVIRVVANGSAFYLPLIVR